jgi:single-strand selective monofunctional uracil DNA glycosylase
MTAVTAAEELVRASRRLAKACAEMVFHDPVRFVYNPLLYARAPHEQYIRKYGNGPRRVIFLGMNPGPWGMAQTGVPFGEVAAVRDWMRITGAVHPRQEMHPRVRITGFECGRSEVSGNRLWGLMQKRFGEPQEFFRTHLVVNYCPLLFLDASGRNVTPDKISRADRQALERECDIHLRAVVKALDPSWLVGIGRFAQGRLETVQREAGWHSRTVLGIPHPSPASPLANRDWAGTVTAILEARGVWRQASEEHLEEHP